MSDFSGNNNFDIQSGKKRYKSDFKVGTESYGPKETESNDLNKHREELVKLFGKDAAKIINNKSNNKHQQVTIKKISDTMDYQPNVSQDMPPLTESQINNNLNDTNKNIDEDENNDESEDNTEEPITDSGGNKDMGQRNKEEEYENELMRPGDIDINEEIVDESTQNTDEIIDEETKQKYLVEYETENNENAGEIDYDESDVLDDETVKEILDENIDDDDKEEVLDDSNDDSLILDYDDTFDDYDNEETENNDIEESNNDDESNILDFDDNFIDETEESEEIDEKEEVSDDSNDESIISDEETLKEILDENIEEKSNNIQEEIDKSIEEQVNNLIEEVEDKKEEKSNLESNFSFYYNYKAEIFNEEYKKSLEKYDINTILSYLRKDTKGLFDKNERIKTMFNEQYMKFYYFTDFRNKLELSKLWIIVGSKYVDFYKFKVPNDSNEPRVKHDDNYPSNITVEEDEYFKELRDKKKRDKERYEKYKIDRTLFEISSDDDEGVTSIFTDVKSLEEEFFKSKFYKIIKQVMSSDRLVNMTKVKCKVIINEATAYIPVIDFSTGIRLICIDTNDPDQYKIQPFIISKKIQFTFRNETDSLRIRILYADECEQRPAATIHALRKLIGYKYFNQKHIITLSNNYTLGYTTERKFIEMFEKGDVDGDKPENSTYVGQKAYNRAIGIITLDRKPTKDRQSVRRLQMLRDTNPNFDEDAITSDDYDLYMILSAEYICNDRNLVNVALTQDQRYVQYVITQYTECNSVIIEDGLQVICAAIIKEHFENYGPAVKYSIEFEYDRDNLLTPGVLRLLDLGDGVELSQNKPSKFMNTDIRFCLPPSRLKLDGVFNFEKGRLDPRTFNSSETIKARYPLELYKRYDLNSKEGVIEFVKSRGFESIVIPAPFTYDIMPYALASISSSDMYNSLQKISIAALGRDSRDSERLLDEQRKLNYMKKLDGTKSGGFIKTFLSIFDAIFANNN